jgi:Domain of unknown function (DUF4258)
MPKLEIPALQRAVSQNRYFITTHAKQRMGQRKVSDQDLKSVIATGDVVEQYPEARPFPKALFMARIKGKPLYVSCAFDGKYAHIVTVHWYDPSVWIDPWTRRKE